MALMSLAAKRDNDDLHTSRQARNVKIPLCHQGRQGLAKGDYSPLDYCGNTGGMEISSPKGILMTIALTARPENSDSKGLD